MPLRHWPRYNVAPQVHNATMFRTLCHCDRLHFLLLDVAGPRHHYAGPCSTGRNRKSVITTAVATSSRFTILRGLSGTSPLLIADVTYMGTWGHGRSKIRPGRMQDPSEMQENMRIIYTKVTTRCAEGDQLRHRGESDAHCALRREQVARVNVTTRGLPSSGRRNSAWRSAADKGMVVI